MSAHTSHARIKGKHGGARRGAGRKPNTHPSRWKHCQIGIAMLPGELDYVKSSLTPAQRRYRLLYSTSSGNTSKHNDGEHTEPSSVVDTGDVIKDGPREALKFTSLRIACLGEAEKDAILELSMHQRRMRLLSMPPGGDVLDVRPGRWAKA
ncbi:MAG: hypothetical protein M3441_04275 [Chloroflexota bacterium]|nr:hypothetical protein [Chloroflexota bacterium]